MGTRLLTLSVFAGLIAGLATLGAGAAGAAAALDEGVSAKGVDIGFITSKTGVAGSTFVNSDQGCKARARTRRAA